MTTQKLTPKQQKVVDCLLAGNTMNFHGSFGFRYSTSNGLEFSYKLIDTMIDKDILKVKTERFAGIAATCKTIVLA
jgi:hypothetical protein